MRCLLGIVRCKRDVLTVPYDDTDQPGMLGFNRFALSGKRDAKPRPGRQTGRQVQSTESPQAEGDSDKFAKSLYVHGLCLEAAEP